MKNSTRTLAPLLLVALAGACASCSSTQRPVVAVLPLDTVGDSAAPASQRMRTALTAGLERSHRFEVVAKEAVDRSLPLLKACAQGQLRQERCAVAAGTTHNAHQVIAGAMGGIGDTFLVQLKLVDVRKAAVIRSLEDSLTGGAETMSSRSNRMIEQLFGPPPRRKWYTRWWLWTALGVAASAAVVLPLVLRHGDSPQDALTLP